MIFASFLYVRNGKRTGMIKRPHTPEENDSAESWSAFERAVDTVVKAPPQHRTPKIPAKPVKVREGGPPLGEAKQSKKRRENARGAA
jgi:hypothetical protein